MKLIKQYAAASRGLKKKRRLKQIHDYEPTDFDLSVYDTHELRRIQKQGAMVFNFIYQRLKNKPGRREKKSLRGDLRHFFACNFAILKELKKRSH